jgi:hypothetical protein
MEKSFEDWCEDLRGREDKDVIVFRDLRNGGVSKQAAIKIWQEREDAKNKRMRDEEFERISKLKQEREWEHTLWRYWCLADWQERFGMLSFFGVLILVGFGAAQIPSITNFLNFIKALMP